MFFNYYQNKKSRRLSPHGESGLKFGHRRYILQLLQSLPAWGEWIEIFVMQSYQGFEGVSPRMGRVD